MVGGTAIATWVARLGRGVNDDLRAGAAVGSDLPPKQAGERDRQMGTGGGSGEDRISSPMLIAKVASAYGRNEGCLDCEEPLKEDDLNDEVDSEELGRAVPGDTGIRPAGRMAISSSTSKIGEPSSLRLLRALSLLRLRVIGAAANNAEKLEVPLGDDTCWLMFRTLCLTKLCVGVLDPSVGVLLKMEGANEVPSMVTLTGEKAGRPRSAKFAEADADRSLNRTFLAL